MTARPTRGEAGGARCGSAAPTGPLSGAEHRLLDRVLAAVRARPRPRRVVLEPASRSDEWEVFAEKRIDCGGGGGLREAG